MPSKNTRTSSKRKPRHSTPNNKHYSNNVNNNNNSLIALLVRKDKQRVRGKRKGNEVKLNSHYRISNLLLMQPQSKVVLARLIKALVLSRRRMRHRRRELSTCISWTLMIWSTLLIPRKVVPKLPKAGQL